MERQPVPTEHRKEHDQGPAVKLISGEKVKLKKCVSRKSGKTFDAVIWVTADMEGKASFSIELPQKGGRK